MPLILNDIKQKALSNLKGFVKVITNLVKDNKIQFDLIIGSGDTGIAMVKLTEMIFSELNIPIPTKLVVPYYRFTKKYMGEGETFQNNAALLPEIKKQLKDLRNIQSILFVDDEIGKGRIVKGFIEFVIQGREEVCQNNPSLYIVAEDRSYNKDQALEALANVQYCPFAESEPMGNAISHIVPLEIKEAIAKSYGNLYPKEELNALLDLPIKDKRENEKPVWSYDLLDDLKKKIINFNKLQLKLELYLKDFITKAIQV